VEGGVSAKGIVKTADLSGGSNKKPGPLRRAGLCQPAKGLAGRDA
jgi:hypothetical protein